MLTLLGTLLRNRRLLKDFVVRDLKARYVGSSMGFFWSVLFPIINLFVYMFVFRVILNARWSDRQGSLEVALVMLAGIVVWTAFAETLSRSTNSLVDNANLIQKVVFPAEILPCYLTVSSLINMCIGLPVVLLSVLWFGHLVPPQVFLRMPGKWVAAERQWYPHEVRLGERHDPYPVFVELTRGWRTAVRVPLEISGSAVRGEDYLLGVDEVEIARGHQRVALLITPLKDSLEEGDETIVIRITKPEGVELVQPGALGYHASASLEITLADGQPLGPQEDPPPRAAPAVRLQKVDEKDMYHPLQLGLPLLCLPLLFVLQVVFTVGVGYVLATLNLFLRDTFHLVGVAITVWMFSTPIFYPASMVVKAGYGFMLAVNPMHWLIESYRSVLLFARWPDPFMIAKLAVAGVLVFFLGSTFFSAHKAKFPDLL